MSATVPQSKPTQKFQKTMGGSIKSLFSPEGRTFFVLEHKTNTQKHKAGETTNFISDYVELGRGNNYAVNFGDDCQTVSRPHAAISRTPNGWLLTPISQTNSTLLNNRAITNSQLLNNGDEIQLAATGPKVSFLIPNNPSTKTLGFTIRMKAAMNEAIRPYKKTIGTISAVFLLLMCGLGYGWYKTNGEVAGGNQKIADLTKEIQKLTSNQDSLVKVVSKIKFPKQSHNKYVPVNPPVNPPDPLHSLYSNVFYLKTDVIEAEIGGKKTTYDIAVAGSGFLLDNGYFVTARHVIEPWNYIQDISSPADTILFALNIIANNNGTITHHMTAVSSSGQKLELTSTVFYCDRRSDVIKQETLEDGTILKYSLPTINDGTDWAACKVNANGGLAFNATLSSSLKAATSLDVLGYPFGIARKVPQYNNCVVAQEGIDNGMIDIANVGFEHGNSGGPVFTKNEKGELVVIGLVSTIHSKQGTIVPISNVRFQ